MKRLFTILLLLLCMQASGAFRLKLEVQWNHAYEGTLYATESYAYETYATILGSQQVQTSGNNEITEIYVNIGNLNKDVYLTFVANPDAYSNGYRPSNFSCCVHSAYSRDEYLLNPTWKYISAPWGSMYVRICLIPDAPTNFRLTDNHPPICNSYIAFNAAMSYQPQDGNGYKYVIEYQKPGDLEWTTASTSHVSGNYFNYSYENSLQGYYGGLYLRVRAWKDGYYNPPTIATTEPSNSIAVFCYIPPKVNNLLIKHACAGGDNGYVAFQLGDNVYEGSRVKVRWASGEVLGVVEGLPNGSTNVPTLSLNNQSFPVGTYQWRLSHEGRTCETLVTGTIRVLPTTSGVTETPCSNGSNEVYSFIVNK